MNTTTLKTFALLGVTLGLGACSTCLQEKSYHGEPYTAERTAGSGKQIYGTSCKTEPKKTVMETPVKQPVKSQAETMFHKKQQK